MFSNYGTSMVIFLSLIIMSGHCFQKYYVLAIQDQEGGEGTISENLWDMCVKPVTITRATCSGFSCEWHSQVIPVWGQDTYLQAKPRCFQGKHKIKTCVYEVRAKTLMNFFHCAFILTSTRYSQNNQPTCKKADWTRKNGHQEEEHVWLPPRNGAEAMLHVTPSSPAWLEGHTLKQVPEGRPLSC